MPTLYMIQILGINGSFDAPEKVSKAKTKFYLKWGL